NQAVCLPQQDHYIVQRQKDLEWKQFTYNYTQNPVFGYEDVAINDLPPSFKLMPPTYMLPKEEQLAGTSLVPHGISLLSTTFQSFVNKFISMKNKITHLSSVEEYKDLIVVQKNPTIIENQTVDQLNDFNWLSDEEFGRQRIQGINAGRLEQLTSDELYQRSIHTKLALADNKLLFDTILHDSINLTFDKALEMNLLYLIDYNIFDDKDYIQAAASFGRYTCSPLALFYVDPTNNKLYPLCIKILQNKEDSPVFTPKSTRHEWILAKLWFQSADGQHMEFITHLFECHMLGEVFAIGTHRHLSATHPVYQLLHPHFNLLLDINWRARGHLLGKDGPIDTLLGPGSVGALQFIGKFNKTYNWCENTFTERLKKNNISTDLNEHTTVANYFFREDGLAVHGALTEFVHSVLKQFYTHPEDVVRDFELHAWLNDLQSNWGGQMKKLTPTGTIESLDTLCTLVVDIIFRLTVEHSIGNHGQWDMYGFTPNVPGALYINPEKILAGNVITHETIIDALPPKYESLSQISITHLLANTDTGLPTLIETPYAFEKDPFLSRHVLRLRERLEKVSEHIQQRNSDVKIPYSYIDPAKVCSSIFI
ncbi:hypothetical protein SAMD00019534_086440, partial [Acytostelium subglobosum LB1]|uniref:hypothetical protein n=1 Tax=Acytostelium subglobosum LB1 TaxID=1410327 RepID=UPI0006449F6F